MQFRSLSLYEVAPIIMGVEGESKGIIEEGNCVICIEPENARVMADAVRQLYNDSQLAENLGSNGRRFVAEAFDRDNLAAKYLKAILDFR